jgi:hypothetical protein
MKKLSVIVILAFVGLSLNAQLNQLNPVTWTFSTKKLSDKSYELHFTADIQKGWHLYSQTQPSDALAIPTTVTINKNPLVKLDGKVKEIGKLEKYKDEIVNATNHQYSGKVDFIQVVKVKSNARTNVTGNVEFQTCDDKKCLPPKTVNFNIALK